MKSIIKLKIKVFLVGLLFMFSLFLTNGFNVIMNENKMNSHYPDNCEVFTINEDPLSISGASGRIHVDDNWTIAKDAGICTGNGTFSKPYIIKDLLIDGGGLGSCILVENSEAYFEIRNCTLFNSGDFPNAAIRLNNVTRGKLILNNCTSSNYYGIYINNCYNTSVSENIANYNFNSGIFLHFCYTITISGNTVNNNEYYGIRLSDCYNSTLTENVMNECSLTISGTLKQLKSYDINTSNLVNGKPLYYYKNEVNLKPDNFLDAGQVILVNCNNSLLTNLDISFSDTAILLYYCDNNTISRNTVNNNNCGLELNSCVGNIISGNVVNYNLFYGIELYDCLNNTISGNMVSNNSGEGIFLLAYCHDNIVSGNIATNNRYGIFFDVIYRNIISGNIANENSYYGIYIYYSNLNIILGNFANDNGKAGIFVDNGDHNTISENTANSNLFYGIQLLGSNYNTISGNTLLGNAECIHEENCQGNKFSDNGECTYGQEDPGPLIPGYSIIVLFGALSVVTIFLVKKVKQA